MMKLRDEFKLRIGIPRDGKRCKYIFCPVEVPREARHKEKRELLISAIEKSIAYSVRITRDKDKYTSHITLSENVLGRYIYEIPKFAEKVAGIDINVDRICAVIADRQGNFIDRKTFYCYELEYVRKNKRDYVIHKTVKEIFEWINSKSVECIVIENLNFKQDMDTQKKLNRIKSNFTYSKIYESIERKALREGIDIKLINPAYTSCIGDLKYTSLYGLSRHESASYVIARRGLGYNERIPVSLLKQIPVLTEEIKRAIEGAEEAAGKKLFKQLEVLENWKVYSPVTTKHKWKLWGLIGRLLSKKKFSIGFT